MKILVVTESYFEHMGILTTGWNRLDTIKAIIKSLLFIVLLGPFLCGTSATFISYYPDRFHECVRAFMSICSGATLAAELASLKMKEKRLKKLIEKFRETVDAAPDAIKTMYYETDKKCKRLTIIAVRIMIFSFIGILGFLTLFSASYNIYRGQMDTDEWFSITNIAFPKERHTVTEFFVKQILTLAVIYALAMTLVIPMCLLFTCNEFLGVLFIHVRSCFAEMDEMACKKRSKSTSMSIEMKKCMVGVIELHIRLAELIRMLSKMMSAPIFFFLMGNIGVVAGSLNLFMVDEFGFMKLEGLVCVISYIFWVFLCCHMASQIAAKLPEIAEVAYQSNWHNYPGEMQRCVRLIINRAQVPFEFDGLNMFYCNMATFASILRLTVSYYLMMKKMSQN